MSLNFENERRLREISDSLESVELQSNNRQPMIDWTADTVGVAQANIDRMNERQPHVFDDLVIRASDVSIPRRGSPGLGSRSIADATQRQRENNTRQQEDFPLRQEVPFNEHIRRAREAGHGDNAPNVARQSFERDRQHNITQRQMLIADKTRGIGSSIYRLMSISRPRLGSRNTEDSALFPSSSSEVSD